MNASKMARHLVAFGAVAASLTGCGSSTQLAATWRDPNGSPTRFNRTLVAFVTKDESLRRSVEDRLAESFPGGTASYRIISTPNATDTSVVRRQLADLGFDGAVVMRVVDVDVKMRSVPGAYWYGTPNRFGNYWYSGWAYPYDPGYGYVEDRVVSIETQVYSLRDDRIVWAARSETTNPKSAGKLTNSVIKHVTKAMRQDGFLAGLARQLDTWVGGAGGA
jgi:hypothetical protein